MTGCRSIHRFLLHLTPEGDPKFGGTESGNRAHASQGRENVLLGRKKHKEEAQPYGENNAAQSTSYFTFTFSRPRPNQLFQGLVAAGVVERT